MKFSVEWPVGVVVVSLAVVLSSLEARASLLQLPHVGGRDSGMAGIVVADPERGASVLFFNPAGVSDLPGSEVSLTLLATNLGGRYTNPDTGFDEKTSENPIAPSFWAGTEILGSWHVGAGLYGSVGSAFNFDGDPDAGIPSRLLARSATFHLGLVAGREILPGLRIGAQVAPTFGSLSVKTPTPLGAVDLDLDGFGVVGSFGLLYDATESLTLGASYRAPGIIFMSGNGRVGGAPDDVDLDFRLPPNVVFGIAYDVADRLTLTGQGWWSDYGDLEKGDFEFDQHPMLDQPYVADARGAWVYGAAAEYQVVENGWARLGLIREEWAIDESAVRPLLWDASSLMLMIGFGAEVGPWILDFATGWVNYEDRLVTAEDQTAFPGRYQLENEVAYQFGITYRFGDGRAGTAS